MEIEKQKEREKRAAFKAKAASFEQKGPSTEDVKASVQKEAAARKFNRLLSKQLSNSDGKNPVSTEINLRNQFNNKNFNGTNATTRSTPTATIKPDWEYVDQGTAGPSYYWNRVTNETTYDIPYELANQDQNAPPPPPPPPPPKRHLPGMEQPPITNSTPVENIETHVQVNSNEDENENDPSNWELVTTQPGGEYYWNVVTNTCTYTMPACIAQLLTSNEENEVTQTVEENIQTQSKWELRWDESYQANYYYNIESGESTWEKPPEFQS